METGVEKYFLMPFFLDTGDSVQTKIDPVGPKILVEREPGVAPPKDGSQGQGGGGVFSKKQCIVTN